MSTSHRILIAEDDSFLRETMQLALEEQGMSVTTVTNGQEAIDFIDRNPPDVLLLDLLMPVKDGFAVLEHNKLSGYDFPTIILSNVSDEMNQEKCTEMGARDFFVKSDMDEDELWDRIQQHLPQA